MKNAIAILCLCATAPPLAAAPGVPAQPPADIVFTNGTVYTVDAANSQAEALAVRDGRIAYVGTSK
ncbi:MAG: hypothetical protein RL684_2231, partial [Pseudomonadota bacterium]